jgi:hypothetical protein
MAIIRKNMSNIDIYNNASMLLEAFKEEMSLPVKVNFYLQKNMNAIVEMAREIDKTRIEIIQKYGKPEGNTGNYSFEDEDMEKANKELSDLFELEQEVKINQIELDWFGSLELSSVQMAAIMFMIKEEEE